MLVRDSESGNAIGCSPDCDLDGTESGREVYIVLCSHMMYGATTLLSLRKKGGSRRDDKLKRMLPVPDAG